jgi:DNA-binding FadR family transcriptional regulator
MSADSSETPALPPRGKPAYGVLKNGRLSESVTAHLTELILSQQLLPGDFLPREEDLSAQLGVSRTAIRESLKVLEAQRLISAKPGVGTIIVGDFDRQLTDALVLWVRGGKVPIADLLEFRRLVEGQAAELAACRATPSDLASLEDAVERMAAGLESEAQDRVEVDVDFHLALARASHNALLALVVGAMRQLLRQSIRRSLSAQTLLEARLDYHRKILKAVQARDWVAARAAVEEHLRDTERVLRAREGGVLGDY